MNIKKPSKPIMYREIREQPEVLKKIISAHSRDGWLDIPELGGFKERFLKAERFYFWGLGSSYHAAVYGNYIFEKLAGLPCEAEMGDELIDRDPVIEPGTVIFALSQSGETADMVRAVKMAHTHKAFTISVTNRPDSTLGGLSEAILPLGAGEEKALAATKTFTAQLLWLALAAFYYKQNRAQAAQNDFIKHLRELPETVEGIIAREREIEELAGKIEGAGSLIILGRRYDYPVALEGALKLKEAAYFEASGYAAEEFRHGPKALLDGRHFTVFIAPQDGVYGKNLAEYKELKNLGANMVLLTGTKNVQGEARLLPLTHELLQPIVNSVFFQLLAYHIGVRRGLDVDKPRNLSKYIN